MRLAIALTFILACAPSLAVEPPVACGDGVPCTVYDNRSYQAKTPPGWDGETPLPVLLHFHGWGRTGTNVVRNKRIVEATDANGMLLLAPDGLGKSWSFWGDSRRDIDFAHYVLVDAAFRFKVDPEQIFISGFSYGSAMAWALACDSGDRYAAVLGIAGTLTALPDRECRTGPFALRQVHGEKDTVMRSPWGNGAAAWQRVLGISACQGNGKTSRKIERYTRETWLCDGGRTVQLDIHPGGHWIPKGWLDEQLRDLLAR